MQQSVRWRRWGRLLLVPLTAGALALQSCVYNKAAGRYQFSLMSEAQEQRVGKQSDQQILAQFGVYDQGSLDAYVARIGRQVAQASDAPEQTWTFRVLDTPVVNAFALPGGYVYVTRGLLAHMQTEAQLATVLGHEIAHVTARHAAQRLTSQQLTNLGLGLTALLFEDVRPFIGLLQAGAQLVFLKYGRDQERQADELGVEYAMAAGYNAADAAAVFATLDRLQAQKGQLLPTWAATHPEPAEREETIPRLAAAYRQAHPPRTYGGTDPAPFLAQLAGTVYGDNPRQGFVRNGTFYHPDLAFQFPVPGLWQVENTASRVLVTAPGAMPPEAAITLLAGKDVPVDQAMATFITSNALQVLGREQTTVNGLPAHVLLSRVRLRDARGQTQTVAVLSYFIRKDDHLYVFHGQAPANRFAAYEAAFKQVMTNFKPLTDKAVLATRPYRIRPFKAPRTAEFDELVRPVPAAKVSQRDLALLNQREPKERITAGTLLKDVRP